MSSGILYFYFLLSGIFYSDCINKYCSSNVCQNSRQHTLCRFQSPGPARHCLEYERTIKSDNDKQAILHKINARRNKVAAGEIRSLPSAEDMLKMAWSKELEESAQRWADQCVTHRHSTGDVLDACRDLDNIQVGQNIATVYGEAPGLTPMSLVDVWYMELLNINSSMISEYFTYKYESLLLAGTATRIGPRSKHREKVVSVKSYEITNESGSSPYKYFTQLVWADSCQVGCGGVKFKERFEDSFDTKNRTVYRLVCNFAPRGNLDGKAVYTIGLPGANCTHGTSKKYTSLCNAKPTVGETTEKYGKLEEKTDHQSKDSHTASEMLDKDATSKTRDLMPSITTEVTAIIGLSTDDNNATFDYFSHLYEYTKELLTTTTPKTSICKKDMAIDEIVQFLKKKLSDDPTLKELFTTTLPIPTGSVFKDASVAAFLNRIYSKTTSTSTSETPNADFVNSTLLVNLVEAVIFRNTDNIQAAEKVTQEIQLRPHYMNPVRVQAEVVAVTPNYDVTGHYFFPEDNDEEAITETTEPDYDMSYAPSMQDVVLEIEEIRRNRPTRDFLYDILETESVVESTTKIKLLSPDDMNLHTGGYSNMKNFLKEIAEKSQSNNDAPLVPWRLK